MQGLMVKFQGGSKNYLFLDPTGWGNSLKVGDKIEDKNYSTPMTITKIIPDISKESGVYDFLGQWFYLNFELKAINITKAPSHRLESRAKQALPLDEARVWYASGNDTLKKAALCVYKESELLNEPTTFEEVLKKLDIVAIKHDLSIPFASAKEYGPKLTAQLKLMLVAKYFNKDWKMRKGVRGYFIGMYSPHINTPLFALGDSWGIFEHSTVVYPGVVYFSSIENAKKAFKILGKSTLLELI